MYLQSVFCYSVVPLHWKFYLISFLDCDDAYIFKVFLYLKLFHSLASQLECIFVTKQQWVFFCFLNMYCSSQINYFASFVDDVFFTGYSLTFQKQKSTEAVAKLSLDSLSIIKLELLFHGKIEWATGMKYLLVGWFKSEKVPMKALMFLSSLPIGSNAVK